MSSLLHAELIRLRGCVQGVGFRPLVWRIATELGVVGWVCNDGDGVLVEAWADVGVVDVLLARIHAELPPLALIDGVERRPLPMAVGRESPPAAFTIIESVAGVANTAVVADAATCPACVAEIFDPANRRFRYPFTNCTHCGPRFSIIHSIPYDRARTSMAAFVMCAECRAEYDDPANRRFHAQPNGCAACGPSLWLENSEGRIECGDVIARTAQLLRDGAIVAIKGVGGFHLACDAANAAALQQLRLRKRRLRKPFALLARDVAMACCYADVSESEADLLCSVEAPIVLLQQAGEVLPDAVAPGQGLLGFALPSSPLHHLLMRELDAPLVLTSGNRSEWPQCIANDAAREQLMDIADYWLLHDREIVNRLDDAVVRVMDGAARVLRRGRGYAPAAIDLPAGFEAGPNVLAMGGALKSSFALFQRGRAVVSQHLGDLESVPVLHSYREALARYHELFDFVPQRVAVDLYGDYLSTQEGRTLGVAVVAVQHHHAHIAAVMAEHGLPLACDAVLGVVLDGIGMGDDGTLWGGEFLLVDYGGYERLACFEPVALPGGAQAMREPWRNTLAQLLHWFEWEELQAEFGGTELLQYLAAKPVATLQQMVVRGINTPLASSAGRLFDAVAAALGICRDAVSYEGEAALGLEALAAALFEAVPEGYPFELGAGRIGWRPLWRALLLDLIKGEPPAPMAARFHRTVIEAVAAMALQLCRARTIGTVVLGGGVWQNRLLLEGVSQRLRDAGLAVLSPRLFPANDGGLALGQGVVAARQTMANPSEKWDDTDLI